MSIIQTSDDFKALISEVKKQKGCRDPIAFGIARVDLGQNDSSKVLQASYPIINWKENYGSAAVFIKH